jgi:hypothetical protein
MSWITKTLRKHQRHLLDMNFLYNDKIQRYQDLYNKFYVGYIEVKDVQNLLNIKNDEYNENQRVVIAIEKKFTDEIVVTYYIQTNRKKLFLYTFDESGKLTREKKDPYGITVTEVFHINKLMDDSYLLSLSNINTIKKLLKEKFNGNKK